MKVTKSEKVGDIEVTISAEASLDEMYDPAVGEFGLRPSPEEGLSKLGDWIDNEMRKSTPVPQVQGTDELESKSYDTYFKRMISLLEPPPRFDPNADPAEKLHSADCGFLLYGSESNCDCGFLDTIHNRDKK